ncbi:lysylphosphatidylglycerol synthase transmembrane domain-containing protein [Hydrogenimonas thermophila]|uniref:lysylphosphatidylglycerol synthase transmembrane domain-containing protein n=1 Tax=Hydrogenimonas thermophila TaxID=223786 RepID=UPI002937125C|nr:lysylphosphatidylglycerol synthase transmembrane domain-containing protein [Hydrogenimonas thermophila]WOE68763.1 lysylphosphatidylglycerol synthase transmembrane domain-containing protein [Hydrogenimonas thermophila]WOE71273.1 lysylphosphatidylglycerol synthase transmembrane domain-containing protein [Hydrogenimonas thermophila]
MKQKIKLLIKILLTGAALWFVLHKVDIERLKESLQSADSIWLFIAFILFNLSKITSSFRLNIYFKAIGLKLSEKFNLILYYVGMFYNLFLPGGIGGDGYKIYLLNKHYKKGIKPLFQAVLLDRLSGLFALAFYACLLFAFSDYSELLGDWTKWLSFLIAILLFPIAYFSTKLFFKDFLKCFNQTLVWGFAVQLLQLLCALAIIKSLYIGHSNLEYITLFLISSVVAVLPLTIGGVGVRELTFLYGLEYIGEDPSLGVTFSFLFFIITAISSLMGLFLLNRVSPKKG